VSNSNTLTEQSDRDTILQYDFIRNNVLERKESKVLREEKGLLKLIFFFTFAELNL